MVYLPGSKIYVRRNTSKKLFSPDGRNACRTRQYRPAYVRAAKRSTVGRQRIDTSPSPVGRSGAVETGRSPGFGHEAPACLPGLARSSDWSTERRRQHAGSLHSGGSALALHQTSLFTGRHAQNHTVRHPFPIKHRLSSFHRLVYRTIRRIEKRSGALCGRQFTNLRRFSILYHSTEIE